VAKPRKPGRALTRTYVKPHDTLKGRTYQARAIDVQSHSDVKCSSGTIKNAIVCAWKQLDRKLG
jgi:hypothetical protein